MALEILEKPDILSLSKDPIAYKIKTSDPQNVKFVLFKIFMESEYGKGDFENILPEDGSLDSPPDKDGETYCHLSFFDKELGYEVFEPYETGAVKTKKICRRYYVEFAEYTNSEGEFARLDNDNYFVLRAGFNFAKFPTRNGNFIPNGTKILTTKPKERFVSDSQHETAFFIWQNAGAKDISRTIFYTDNTTEIITENISVGRFQPIITPIGYATQNYADKNPSKEIDRIEIGTGNGTTSTITEGEKPLKFELVGSDIVITRNDSKSFIDDDGLRDKLPTWLVVGFNTHEKPVAEMFGQFGARFGDILSVDDESQIQHSTITFHYREGYTLPDEYEKWAGEYWTGMIYSNGGTSFTGIRYGTDDVVTFSGGGTNTEKITLYPYPSQCLRNYREFYYQNSLGGVDSFVCQGEFEEGTEKQTDTHLHYVPKNYDAIEGEYDVFNTIFHKSIKVASGWKTEGERKAFTDFFTSEHCWEMKNGMLTKIIISDKKETAVKSDEFLKAVNFSYRYAHDENAVHPIN